MRGDDSIAELCRQEGIAQSQYNAWSKEFMEAGKKRLAGDTEREANTGGGFELDPATLNSLKEVISLNWVGDEKLTSEFKAPISKAVAWFLSSEKNSKLQPTDPVAKFHLGNGASLLRVNWPADASQNGLDGSFGAMVNYKYSLDESERNHERFVESGEVEISNESAKLAKDFNKALNIV